MGGSQSFPMGERILGEGWWTAGPLPVGTLEVPGRGKKGKKLDGDAPAACPGLGHVSSLSRKGEQGGVEHWAYGAGTASMQAALRGGKPDREVNVV